MILSLVNANSPLVWDATMLGAARVYAQANQAVLVTPFILAGAMSPVTVAGASAQTLAEALAGMAFVQLVRPGAPVVLGSFASSMSVGSGPTRDGEGVELAGGDLAAGPVDLRVDLVDVASSDFMGLASLDCLTSYFQPALGCTATLARGWSTGSCNFSPTVSASDSSLGTRKVNTV